MSTPSPEPSAEELKRAAGIAAAETVQSGMKLGLGTGSTVAHFLDELGRRLKASDLRDIVGVPTSIRTEEAARRLGIPLIGIEEAGRLDLAVDGADEVDPSLDLIKGLGGALLREKMVAQAADRLVIIADERKVVDRLGTISPLPVEVISFGYAWHIPWLEGLGAAPTLRTDSAGSPYITDNHNYVLDCRFRDGIGDPEGLDRALQERAGIVDSGLFLGMADSAVIAGSDGVRIMERETP